MRDEAGLRHNLAGLLVATETKAWRSADNPSRRIFILESYKEDQTLDGKYQKYL
jgi:hypothetical protein